MFGEPGSRLDPSSSSAPGSSSALGSSGPETIPETQPSQRVSRSPSSSARPMAPPMMPPPVPPPMAPPMPADVHPDLMVPPCSLIAVHRRGHSQSARQRRWGVDGCLASNVTDTIKGYFSMAHRN
uniref:Uncharacterized protein n=1 Tax=Brassica oleracea var. oleracea TaxID=109376 RepID=A0A0D2ZXR3_BRAOL